MRTILVCMLLALIASPALAGPAQIQNALIRLFATEDPDTEGQNIAGVLEAAEGDANALRAAILADTGYDKFRPGWQRFTTQVSDGPITYNVDYLIRVPRNYTPEKSWPLLVAAHGQGGKADHIGWPMEFLLGADVEKYVILAATMPKLQGHGHGHGHDDTYGGWPWQEQVDLKPLAWTRRYLNIDSDRIVMAGYSMGATRTWHTAILYPHLLAGAVPMAGVPWFEGGSLVHDMYLENLNTVPVWAIWGEKDGSDHEGVWGNVDFFRNVAKRMGELGNKDFKGTEIPGAGHGECWPSDAGEFQKFLASCRRQTIPAKLVHCFHLPVHGRSHYLEATALATPPPDFNKQMEAPIPPGQKPTTDNAFTAIKTVLAKWVYRFTGALDTPKNTLTITAKSIRSMRLYVTEGMFDLSKPVTIHYWSKTWTGVIPVSPECMIAHYAATRDRAAIVYNEVDMDIAGKIKVKYAGRTMATSAPASGPATAPASAPAAK